MKVLGSRAWWASHPGAPDIGNLPRPPPIRFRYQGLGSWSRHPTRSPKERLEERPVVSLFHSRPHRPRVPGMVTIACLSIFPAKRKPVGSGDALGRGGPGHRGPRVLYGSIISEAVDVLQVERPLRQVAERRARKRRLSVGEVVGRVEVVGREPV